MPTDPAERYADALAPAVASVLGADIEEGPASPDGRPILRDAILSGSPTGCTGATLRPEVRARLAAATGLELSRVRIHSNPDGARSAKRFGAAAFAYGPDIWFGAGRLETTSAAGRHLLAHELVHAGQHAEEKGAVYRFPEDAQGAGTAESPADMDSPGDDAAPDDAESWQGVNEIKWEHDHWTYIDETGVVWNYVVIVEDKPVTELESEWVTEETRFDPWSFWLVKREPVVHHGLRAVTRVRPTVSFEGWLPSTPETISVTGTVPKEEKGLFARATGWVETALDWGFGPKKIVLAYQAIQFVRNVRDKGIVKAGEDYAINKLEDKAIDTALKVGKKVVQGSGKKTHGHHEPPARSTQRPRFHLTHELTDAEKDRLRADARKLAETARGGRRLAFGSEVHHRVPLEFAHLQPTLNPNRLENLIVITDREARLHRSAGLGQNFHLRVHELWLNHLKKLKHPTAAEVEDIASQIDTYIRSEQKWTVERLK